MDPQDLMDSFPEALEFVRHDERRGLLGVRVSPRASPIQALEIISTLMAHYGAIEGASSRYYVVRLESQISI